MPRIALDVVTAVLYYAAIGEHTKCEVPDSGTPGCITS